MFKVNKRNTRKKSETCFKLTIKTPKQHHWFCSGAFIVNFEHISHLFLVIFIVDFEQVCQLGYAYMLTNCHERYHHSIFTQVSYLHKSHFVFFCKKQHVRTFTFKEFFFLPIIKRVQSSKRCILDYKISFRLGCCIESTYYIVVSGSELT